MDISNRSVARQGTKGVGGGDISGGAKGDIFREGEKCLNVLSQ